MSEIPDFAIPQKKVDSSWKEEVRKERELMKQQQAAAGGGAAGAAGAGAVGSAPPVGAQRPGAGGTIPSSRPKAGPAAGAAPDAATPAGASDAKPSKVFMNFLSGLVQQALMQLGQMENPFTGGRDLDLEGAKYTVELLGVIQEKTKGNLAPQEDRALAEAVRELKMYYVEVANEVSKQMQEQIKKMPPPGGKR